MPEDLKQQLLAPENFNLEGIDLVSSAANATQQAHSLLSILLYKTVKHTVFHTTDYH